VQGITYSNASLLKKVHAVPKRLEVLIWMAKANRLLPNDNETVPPSLPNILSPSRMTETPSCMEAGCVCHQCNKRIANAARKVCGGCGLICYCVSLEFFRHFAGVSDALLVYTVAKEWMGCTQAALHAEAH